MLIFKKDKEDLRKLVQFKPVDHRKILVRFKSNDRVPMEIVIKESDRKVGNFLFAVFLRE